MIARSQQVFRDKVQVGPTNVDVLEIEDALADVLTNHAADGIYKGTHGEQLVLGSRLSATSTRHTVYASDNPRGVAALIMAIAAYNVHNYHLFQECMWVVGHHRSNAFTREALREVPGLRFSVVVANAVTDAGLSPQQLHKLVQLNGGVAGAITQLGLLLKYPNNPEWRAMVLEELSFQPTT
mgnify:CR=1 FL=1